MITDGEKWHYLTVKSLSRLPYGITSNHHGDFYCLGCLHSFRTDSALKQHKRFCGNHDYCCVDMPDKGETILKYYSWEKSSIAPFPLYADFEYLLIKELPFTNNSEKSYTERKAKHKHSGYLLIEFSLFVWFDEKQALCI